MGGLEESYCLKWNDFHMSVVSSFAELRKDPDLFDVTLICDGRPIYAHRLVLSACSQVFRQLIKSSRNAKDPTILLWNIKHKDMEALLNFMYQGEVNITQDNLNHFLDLAERLKVKGLTSSVPPSASSRNSQSTLKTQPVQSSLLASRSNVSPIASTKVSNNIAPGTSLLNPNKKSSSDNIQDNEEIMKHDDLDNVNNGNEDEEDESANENVDEIIPNVITEMQTDENDSTDFDPTTFLNTNDSNLNDDAVDTSMVDQQDGNSNSSLMASGSGLSLANMPQFSSPDTSFASQTHQMEPIIAPDGTKEFACHYCEKRYLTRSRLKRHVLDVHEKGAYPCPDCGKIFTSTRRLKDHQRSRYCHGVSRAIINPFE